ncbi:PhzF family phenazine biosynthesis protein [Paraburkholderia strydomiana]|uniref:PhzF family phenazine biosynthesis protein n=1 Tax=Paraburkholderia strydomiana TaxID=1245417 RepID=UPI00286110AC|nr:PhzF family phenazine biosynthesis isomerase [Paraburkholderia strydomiana]MDR7009351.1 PhzF family phenazine biosynthesis protein [Paraburkholderia strydomiana]
MTFVKDASVSPYSFNAAFPPRGNLHFVRVFPSGPGGGNPAPVVLDADAMPADAMKAIAAHYGHESAFVCMPHDAANTMRLRFFVPEHEMEMCGHATLGALWLLRRLGRWTSRVATLETLSGIVDARYCEHTQSIAVSQPKGSVVPVGDETLRARICDVLRINVEELDSLGIVNATTSRTKTLIPVRSVQRLNSLTPSLDDVQELCDALGSTGLYPFAVESAEPLNVHARQFPRSSGYPEDAATGIAAAAMLYGALHYRLLAHGASDMIVHQGYAMGKPSCILVRMRIPGDPDAGCWISGAVESTTLEPVQ